ncbi:MAG: M24 family metallopeptidase [Solirubrobacterales bacterium]
MNHPRDEKKLARIRGLMEEQDLDALVLRAPDDVLYASNYWCMKGYDIVVFPREGEMTLCVMDPQLQEAAGSAWTTDLRGFRFYAEDDPRPPLARATDLAVDVLRERGLTGRIGVELSLTSQAADRMVGEPSVAGAPFFEAFASAAAETVDCVPLLAAARAIKTEQEIERMRRANEIAALAMAAVRAQIRPGMRESEVGALFEGQVHAIGTGFNGEVDLARGFTLVWSGPGIRTFTATADRPVQEREPTLLEIWVCADGYWTDLTKNVCPGELTPEYDQLLDQLLEIFAAAVGHCTPGASMAELDKLVRDGLAEAGYPGQPTHPIAHGVGARAHEPPWPHQAAGGTIEENMVLAIEPAAYWPGGGGLRLEDNFLITAAGAEKLCADPDDFREAA